MSQQYRTAPPPCPLCAGSMEDRAAADAVVDVCTACHAVWIDWFDGDVAAVAGEIRVEKTIPARIADKHPCPRCRTELVSERLFDTGPFVYRCKDCSGVLVPSAILDDVVALGHADQRGDRPETGSFSRMIAKLRKIFSSTSA